MDAIEKIKDFWPEWTIEGPLGRGSYGKVYSASRSDAGKKYYSAIKVMTIPSGEEEIEQVRAEDSRPVNISGRSFRGASRRSP